MSHPSSKIERNIFFTIVAEERSVMELATSFLVIPEIILVLPLYNSKCIICFYSMKI